MSNAVVEGIAGAIGACVSVIVTYPLLTVSTVKSVDARSSKLPVTSSLVPGAIRDVILEARKLGVAGLFAGLKPAVAGTAVSQGIYFAAYSRLRQLAVARKLASQGRAAQAADSHAEGIGMAASILVASAAGILNVLITNPVWVVVTQLQASSSPAARAPSSFWAAVQQVWQESGWRGFWRGVLPSLVMVANPTVQFFLYEALVARWLVLRRRPGQKPAPLGMLDVFLLSALSKIGATLTTYPMLVIKNRLQAQTLQTTQRYAGVWDAVVRILQTEGAGGLYKGMQVKLVQTVLAAALLMSLKEEVYNATKAVLHPGPAAITAAAAAAAAQPARSVRG